MSLSRRRFFGLFACAAASRLAVQPRRRYQPPFASRELRSLFGVHVRKDIREPLPGAALGIERRQNRTGHIAGAVEPARLHAHLENTGGQVPGGDWIHDERLLGVIAATKPECHAGAKNCRCKGLDLRQAGPFDFGDGLRPVVQRAVPGGDLALAEDRCGHPSAPSVGVPRIVAELMGGDILPASTLVENFGPGDRYSRGRE
jgi:hypothetical protein